MQTYNFLKQILALSLLASFVLLINGCSYKPKNLDPSLLQESLSLGTQFLLQNQTPKGNFNYEYNFVTKTYSSTDNDVRQAGALWGLALIHQVNPTPETKAAILKGLDFFEQISKTSTDNIRYIVYDDAEKGSTGTVALVSLALIDFLRTEEDFPNREHYVVLLDQYLNFLYSLRTIDDQFYSQYTYAEGEGVNYPSPYFDGETLLALVKAVKYLGYDGWRPFVLSSANAMYNSHVTKALLEDPDSAKTKGFYQWGSMAFYEIYNSSWGKVTKYARTLNTSYAYEGLISAWELARLTNDLETANKLAKVIDEGLYRLTTWQVDHSLQNSFLKEHPTKDAQAIGGIMNSADDPNLRIDVTQHQMHAVILALKFLF
ncbi:MAG: hypothetical protein UT55_C0036G0001 [Candidatus Peregrinibacteria bacterium GW2011_GWE2_39_6]|nr:MAG: hypothetical protein UT55_C0036G0001 [Candidatus Peregrinibacteria bacterium GW2011_GWE2_39_6]